MVFFRVWVVGGCVVECYGVGKMGCVCVFLVDDGGTMAKCGVRWEGELADESSVSVPGGLWLLDCRLCLGANNGTRAEYGAVVGRMGVSGDVACDCAMGGLYGERDKGG